jgi:hypothetical protein
MDVQALVGTTGAGTAAGAAAPVSSTPATPPATSDTSHVLGAVTKKSPGGIAAAIAKIYGGDSANAHLSEPAVNVSYKIEGKTIHTVFTDPTTGQEIAQFPPDLLQHIAAFFDAEQGVTLDKEA